MRIPYRLKTGIKKYSRLLLKSHAPSFIIIGAQKSGTSSLHYYLDQHPDIKGSQPKEIHYFDKWINYGYSLRWYENHFKSFGIRKKLFFESSPNYIYYETAAKKISELYPNIKLILILRNPIDRAFSAWNMYKQMFEAGMDFKKRLGKHPNQPNLIHEYLFKDRGSFPSLMETIEIEEELMETNELDEPSILRRGIYVEQIKNYLKYFDRKQLLILGFYDLFDNINITLKDICYFLGINSYHNMNIDTSPRNKRIYDRNLDPEDHKNLKYFYKDFNNELFEMLGKEINW